MFIAYLKVKAADNRKLLHGQLFSGLSVHGALRTANLSITTEMFRSSEPLQTV